MVPGVTPCYCTATPPPFARRPRTALGRLRRLLTGCLFAGVFLPLTPAAEPDAVETVEQAATQWVKTRAETSRIQTEWSSQQQLLESMVNGLTERAQTLENKRDYLQAKTAKDREEIAQLETTNKATTDAMDAMETHLRELDAQLLQLRPSLPPRLSEALELSYRSLAAKELTVSERMQLTMTVLNRCVQFNRSITCEEEVLKLGGAGNGQLVDVIYWGLSHGYALDRTTGSAWFGSPGAQGWQWEPVADGAKPVGQLIAIYRSKGEPDFVAVPGRLKNTGGETSGK
jgi:hypothetical protein